MGIWGVASNDTDYKLSRHRTLPILASTTPIANCPIKVRNRSSPDCDLNFFIDRNGAIAATQDGTTNSRFGPEVLTFPDDC